MLDAAELSRRRELQGKAFAAGGGLTDAEAAELRALDARHVAAVPAVIHPVTPTVVEDDVPLPDEPEPEPDDVGDPVRDEPPTLVDDVPRATWQETDAPASGVADEVTPSEARAESSPRRRRRWLAPVALALAVLVGVGIGWLAFRESGPSTAGMTAAQRDQQFSLEETGEYDPGTVEYLGAEEQALVWRATQADGNIVCLIITVGAQQGRNCQQTDLGADLSNLSASVTVTEDDEEVMYWATLMKDVNGRTVALVDRQADAGVWDWRSQYSTRELDIVLMLEERGYSGPSLNLVGVSGEDTIWIAYDVESCVIVATDDEIRGEECGSGDFIDSVRVELPDVTYEVSAGDGRGHLLMIYPTGTAPTPSAGSTVRCDDAGECVSIDDKTGD